jgi:hypothetical protein
MWDLVYLGRLGDRILFSEILKLFVLVDMDGCFPMRRYK